MWHSILYYTAITEKIWSLRFDDSFDVINRTGWTPRTSLQNHLRLLTRCTGNTCHILVKLTEETQVTSEENHYHRLGFAFSNNVTNVSVHASYYIITILDKIVMYFHMEIQMYILLHCHFNFGHKSCRYICKWMWLWKGGLYMSDLSIIFERCIVRISAKLLEKVYRAYMLAINCVI